MERPVTILILEDEALIADDIQRIVLSDGDEFDPKTLHASGLGLMAMRERAIAIDGQLEIEASPGNGTRIVIRL